MTDETPEPLGLDELGAAEPVWPEPAPEPPEEPSHAPVRDPDAA